MIVLHCASSEVAEVLEFGGGVIRGRSVGGHFGQLSRSLHPRNLGEIGWLEDTVSQPKNATVSLQWLVIGRRRHIVFTSRSEPTKVKKMQLKEEVNEGVIKQQWNAPERVDFLLRLPVILFEVQHFRGFTPRESPHEKHNIDSNPDSLGSVTSSRASLTSSPLLFWPDWPRSSLDAQRASARRGCDC